MKPSASVARIVTADPRERASWEALAEVSARMPIGWSLAGGSLVRLHLAERAMNGGRSTRDIDLILDVRANPGTIQRMVATLQAMGFEPDGVNLSGQDHRWVRGAAQIDVLTPDFLGSRILGRKYPGLGRVLTTRGAQFGLYRTQRVTVQVDDFEMEVNRPDLVGALYEKCSALLVPLDLNKDRHLGDIEALASVLAPDDRRDLLRLRHRERRRIASGLRQAGQLTGLNERQKSNLGRLESLIVRSL